MPEYDLRQVELRQEIRAHILSGRVDEATSLLNEHFPTVLSGPVAERTTLPSAEGIRIADAIPYISPTSVEPIHLVLNLRILSFIEACRTIPLPYPVHDPGDTPQQTPIQVDNADPEVSLENQLALLSKAQKLLGLANTLPNARERELYLKELKNVSGLLAYKVPEHSSISKYLTQERREAVADQIHRAILDRTGQPSVSSLELLARHTSTVWSFAHQVGAKPRPGMPIPPTASPTEQKEVETVPPFDLERFLESR
ncbi:hypothetical protein H0H81_010106 [Sphagnurus paluster]|uniref:CRA domain-containing protein n=1 Tax=Sphagnurus paluster TaxID=117069 RepID=A0A9P7KKP4_9AGAR|nr:hypothetical protein H0H81_010106 [Sphagnurus paluster]